MITSEKLMAEGYRVYVGNQKFTTALHCIASYQKAITTKRGRKKFFININEYMPLPGMPEEVADNYRFEASVQFENGETFNVEFFVRQNHEIKDVEDFYKQMFKRMKCFAYDRYN